MNKVTFWQRPNFFRELSPDSIPPLLEGAAIVETSPKEVLFNKGDPADHFGFVIEGVFKLHRADNLGHRVVMDFVKSGGLIAGLLMAAEDSTYPVNVQSLKAGKFLKIPKITYTKFWCQRPEVIKRFQIANMERVQSIQFLRDSQRLPLEQKVAWVLIKLLVDKEENGYFRIYFSRIDIADAVGAASESVIRVFSKWLKEAIIFVIDGEEFVDLKKLSQVLEGITS